MTTKKPYAEFTVTADARADLAVATHLEDLSRRTIRDLFAAKLIRVDGKLARKGDLVHAGQRVEISDAPQSRAPQPIELDIDIIYEDDSIVAINKPAHLATHPLEAGESDTAANWLVARYPETNAIGDDEREAGFVHRLDRGTTGVLVAAKDRSAWEALRLQFSKGTAKKSYWALVEGFLASGESTLPLVRRGTKTVVADQNDPSALHAHTRWTPLETSDTNTLLAVELLTGRTHQIRAHLSLAGRAIVGDTLYGASESNLAGHFLHAASVRVTHPVTEQPIDITAPLPADRADYLQSLGWASPDAKSR